MATFLGTRKTDTVTLFKNNLAYTESTDFGIFTIDGVGYMRKKAIARKKKAKDPQSNIWKCGEALVRQTDGHEVFFCWLCEIKKKDQLLPILNGTKGGLDHLSKAHQIGKDGNIIDKPSQSESQRSIQFSTLVTTQSFDEFKRLLIRWFVYC